MCGTACIYTPVHSYLHCKIAIMTGSSDLEMLLQVPGPAELSGLTLCDPQTPAHPGKRRSSRPMI